jgi:hypothetical protein
MISRAVLAVAFGERRQNCGKPTTISRPRDDRREHRASLPVAGIIIRDPSECFGKGIAAIVVVSFGAFGAEMLGPNIMIINYQERLTPRE